MKIKSYKKQINENGFIIIKKLINKKEIKELLQGFETVIDYCISLISKRKKLKNLDQKYLWLQKQNNKLKGRGYDISRFHPSLYKVIFNKKLKFTLANIVFPVPGGPKRRIPCLNLAPTSSYFPGSFK